MATLSAKTKGEVHFFGEMALLENENRTATVVVKSSDAKCLVLDRESFNLLLGPLKDIIEVPPMTWRFQVLFSDVFRVSTWFLWAKTAWKGHRK